jgi:Protein of unknown function (DUF3780)
MLEPFDPPTPAFGIVDLQAEHGLCYLDTAPGTTCRLTLVARTERGYPRRELATIPGAVWKRVAPAVQKELVRGMDPAEQGPKPPFLRHGDNALSPLILREVAVLFWSLMEDGEGTHIDALLNGWRQLAREERWWLYARASNPTQRQGQGWRRALYFGLTDPADTRTAPRLLEIMEAATAQKKTCSATPPVSYRKVLRQLRAKQRRLNRKSLPKVSARNSPPPSRTSPEKTSPKRRQRVGN